MYNSNLPNVNSPNLFIEAQCISVTFSSVGLPREFISNLTDHYLETVSGHTQWEPPASGSPAGRRVATSNASPHKTTSICSWSNTSVLRRRRARRSYLQYQRAPATGGSFSLRVSLANRNFQAHAPTPTQPAYYNPDYKYGQPQQPVYEQGPVDELAGQFGTMGMGCYTRPISSPHRLSLVVFARRPQISSSRPIPVSPHRGFRMLNLHTGAAR